ncbi:hypothetical protein [Pseudoduganella violacea]|uniref:Uncharacterized protein n=1 Tax=Pseudoduganella violacea TaxID=1715466 RepID=A0A7W5BD53_9BURK|nr:hypothetical protein [Pseudoduganella violacea]MBB3121004.1 hypothetical protein [Pseudoduganella violacea]
MASLRVGLTLLLLALAGLAGASSNPQTYALSWSGKGEVLSYRSCGCADGCWVAELRKRKTKRLKASLRCDCENLLYTYPAKSAERAMGKSCSAINDSPGKQEAISETMKHIVQEGGIK